MHGALFKLGEQKPRPNVYARIFNAGELEAAPKLGVGAAVIKSNWGPLNELVEVDAENVELLGTGEGPQVVEEAINGGAHKMLVVRAGEDGKKPEAILKDSEGLDALKLTGKYPSSRKFTVQIRKSLSGAEKELNVYENSKILERLLISTSDQEIENAVKVINESSLYLNASKVGEGVNIQETLSAEVQGGTDPTTTGESYVNALNILDLKFFDAICVDTEDPSVHASLHAFVKRKLSEGFRVLAFVGEKPTVPFETRKENAKAFDDFIMHYVGNGALTARGELVGAKLAAHILGMAIGLDYKKSLTKKLIKGSLGVAGELTPKEYNEAAECGMLVLSTSVEGQAQIDYGINTLTTFDEEKDEGWRKIRRVKTRFELMDRISYELAIAMRNDVDNGNDGRQHVITIANGIINDMIAEGGLESGQLVLDENNPPSGESAWYKLEDLVDLDGIEKLYIAFGFKY